MKRQFDTLYVRNEQVGYGVGDEAAHRAASALADRSDAPTVQLFSDILAMSDIIGGQFHVTCVREKVDRYGNQVGDGDGEWSTVGLVVHFETRDIRVEQAKAPTEIRGLPVTDSQAPPIIVEASQGPIDAELDELAELAAEEEAAGEEEPIEEPVAVPE